jgi:hypothetical protein
MGWLPDGNDVVNVCQVCRAFGARLAWKIGRSSIRMLRLTDVDDWLWLLTWSVTT